MGKHDAHTKDEDLGWKDIDKQVKLFEKNPYVMVGVQETAGAKKVKTKGKKEVKPTTVALVASVMEFGSEKENVPERSFIRSTMDQDAGELNEITDKLIDKVLDGSGTVQGALKILGTSIEGRIKKKIQSITEPALSAKTIKRKGSDKPLIDTGQMINSIRYVVVMEGDGSAAAGETVVGKDDD